MPRRILRYIYKRRNIYTLGPLGPLLQRGVLVVLQSAQTLTAVLLILFKELLLLLISVVSEGGIIRRFWSSNFCIELTGVVLLLSEVVIIFRIILIFEGIHLTELVSLWSSFFFQILNLSPSPPSFFGVWSWSSHHPPCETSSST